jgi:hypothetical protein
MDWDRLIKFYLSLKENSRLPPIKLQTTLKQKERSGTGLSSPPLKGIWIK